MANLDLEELKRLVAEATRNAADMTALARRLAEVLYSARRALNPDYLRHAADAALAEARKHKLIE